MTLHEAMIKAINELGGVKQHIQDVTDYINTRHLYSRGDNATLPVNQVSARLNRYKNIFGRADGYIWIKDRVY